MCQDCKYLIDLQCKCSILTFYLGQAHLSTKCAICDHEPVEVKDLKLNSPLRNTIKQWLQNRLKVRNEASASGSNTPPLTPDAAAARSSAQEPGQNSAGKTAAPSTEVDIFNSIHFFFPTTKAHQSTQSAKHDTAEPQLAKEEKEEAQTPKSADMQEKEQPVQKPTNDHDSRQRSEQLNGKNSGQNGEEPNTGMTWNESNGQMVGNGFDFDPNQAGFQNMDWGNNGMFNPMMQMPMQGGWNGFPMGARRGRNWSSGVNRPLGMNSMDFSPTMFGGFNMQGMNPAMAGMNGMNMNYGGGYGWNGHMGGDFGANAGYYPNGGYNMHQHQQYPNRNFHNQNRFHGPGSAQRGFGRGSFGSSGRGGSQGYMSRPDSRHSSQSGMKQDSSITNAVNGASPSQATDSTEAKNVAVNQPSEQPKQQDQSSSSPSATKESADDQAHQDDTANIDDEQFGPAGGIDESILPDFGSDTRDTVRTPKHQTNPAEPTEAPASSNAGSSGSTGSINIITEIPSFDPTEGSPTPPSTLDSQVPESICPSYTDTVYGMDTPTYDQYPYPNQSWENNSPNTFAPRGRGRGGVQRGGFQRGGFGGRGASRFNRECSRCPPSHRNGTASFIEPPVEGAPTGPKAWREGNISRGRGGSMSLRGGFTSAPRQSTLLEQTDPQTQSSQRTEAQAAAEETSEQQTSSNFRDAGIRRHKPSSSRHDTQDDMDTINGEDEDRPSGDQRDERSKRTSRRHSKNIDMDSLNGDLPDRPTKKDGRSRDASVDSYKHRSSRYDRESRRSSRSHRRHRDRSRSRSPDYTDDDLKASKQALSLDAARRKARPTLRLYSDLVKEKHDSESRRRSRYEEYRDRCDKEKARDHERERDRDRDRERRHRRDHSESESTDRHHRSSRRSGRDRDRDRSRERRRRHSPSRSRSRDHERSARGTRPESDLTTPAPAAQDEFTIAGRSSRRPDTAETTHAATSTKTSQAPATAPTGPASMAPPRGPRASINADRPVLIPRGPSRATASSRQPTAVSPTTPVAPAAASTGNVDIYAAERERARQERLAHEERKKSLSTRASAGDVEQRKRSYGDVDDVPVNAPTGPRAEREGKRRRGLNERVERMERVEREREEARYR